jgi:hypothetical protein
MYRVLSDAKPRNFVATIALVDHSRTALTSWPNSCLCHYCIVISRLRCTKRAGHGRPRAAERAIKLS